MDGIRHDFERQRFTELGDYRTFLARALGPQAEPRPPAPVSPADGRDSGPGRAIPATPAADDAAGSNGDEARGEDAAAPSSQAPAQPAPADRD